MRKNYFSKAVITTLISGILLGAVSVFFHTTSTTDLYGAWIPGFYQGEPLEILIKSAFLTVFFTISILITGLFMFGYLFVLPINYYYGYTVGFLSACAIRCFGTYSVPFVVLKLPTVAMMILILHKLSCSSAELSAEILSRSFSEKSCKKTARYLYFGIIYIILTGIPLVYDSALVPKLLNLWDSF